MDFENFLYNLSNKDLKILLSHLELHVTARNKQELVERILSKKEISKINLLLMLNKQTIKQVLRKSGEKLSGRKKDLVNRLLLREILKINDKDVFDFLKGKDLCENEDYMELLNLVRRKTSLKPLILLLIEATEPWVKKISNRIIVLGPKDSIGDLVELISNGNKDIPCYAGYILENIMVSTSTSVPVQVALNKHKDRIRARRRIIDDSYEHHPKMKQPTVNEFLKQIWESAPPVKPKKDADMQQIKNTTTKMANGIEELQKGMVDIDERLKNITIKIEKSPEMVAEALSAISKSKAINRKTRKKIKKDLDKFFKLTGRAQKIEYLLGKINTYGPLIINALGSLLQL